MHPNDFPDPTQAGHGTATAARPQETPTAPRTGLQHRLRSLASNPVAPMFMALALTAVALSILTPHFLTLQNLSTLVAQASVVGIAACGATFVILTGGIDLSVGSNIALSGMIAASAVAGGANAVVGIIIAVGVGFTVGAFNASSITFLKLTPFIVTLAVLGMARGLTLQMSEGESVYDLPAAFLWLGSGVTLSVPNSAWLLILVFLTSHIVLTRTVFGHQVLAVGGNRQAARLAGIRDDRVIWSVYAVAGLCAGLAAVVLVGRLGSATPTAAAGLELQVIAAVVIGGTSLFGGKGSMFGTMVGVLLIAVINNGLTLLNVSPFWVQFMQGALIFIAVLVDAVNSRRLTQGRH